MFHQAKKLMSAFAMVSGNLKKTIPATQPVLFCSDIKAGDVAPLVTQLFSRNFYSEKT
jgi:hypothetical protein